MKLTINRNVATVPKTLRNVALVDFIRDFLGLKGTKFGCGMGLCGACTVHVDGVAVRSCQLQVADVADGHVTTIEGLTQSAHPDTLHPVQQAWVDDAVPQCGYCQPGQIMTAAAFLDSNPDPTNEEIRAAMAGNLCRCGTYTRIRCAVARAAKEIQHARRR